jgi:SAM-dependent methyltransferase
MALSTQSSLWSIFYACFLALIAVTMVRSGEHAAPSTGAAGVEDAPGYRDWLLWLVLAAVPSALLVTVTGYMLRDIAPMPLLWVFPLAVYLLTLVMSFAATWWYRRWLWYPLFLLAAFLMLRPIGQSYIFINYRSLVALYGFGLFCGCCVCHAEMAASRPGPRHLTTFYLVTSAGSALGGLLAGVLAPLVLEAARFDLSVVIIVALWIGGIALWHQLQPTNRRLALTLTAAYAVVAGTIVDRYLTEATAATAGTLVTSRTFYGPLRVSESDEGSEQSRVRELLNGAISHGKQFTSESRRRDPITYYAPESGVGVTLRTLGRAGPIRVGVIGLGVGTLAAYGRSGDAYRFYELNPAVVDIAQRYFWFLRDCAAAVTVVTGDARLSLEREPPQQLDALAVDAFSSDAVPVHLLTKEAFGVYLRHLRPDGVLALHVTNRYVDLASVTAAAATAWGRPAYLFSNPEDSSAGGFSSDWVLVSARASFFDEDDVRRSATPVTGEGTAPWTDDYSSLWKQLR